MKTEGSRVRVSPRRMLSVVKCRPRVPSRNVIGLFFLRAFIPRLLNHWVRSKDNWKANTIPILLHGDAVPVFQVGKAAAQSFDTYSVQSCWVFETVMVSKMYLFGLVSHQATEKGWETIWKMMHFSLFALFTLRECIFSHIRLALFTMRAFFVAATFVCSHFSR